MLKSGAKPKINAGAANLRHTDRPGLGHAMTAEIRATIRTAYDYAIKKRSLTEAVIVSEASASDSDAAKKKGSSGMGSGRRRRARSHRPEQRPSTIDDSTSNSDEEESDAGGELATSKGKAS